ncbi:Wadjet anti-phage system protein JetD domain-containing protein [Arenimonas caeni]|uniref:Wadjet protein JetD C-terminal domain-containing protein n=1 Tax=Arenimonas caeni TaxID=2058085 RepID=A0A2P6M6T8_9GAMM|nr:Wadjet anti-phage system protein JetD domain-containing protein [Arenimonas caeni]PRH81665.1 hypothetical protein C6N40_11310 [Arenimonas caeni]
MTPARTALERLLRRAEAAHRRGGDRPVRMKMTEASCPEYTSLPTLEDLESFEAQVRLAEREGAIVVDRDRLRGDGERLKSIEVRDIARLASHLGIVPHGDQVAAAEKCLAPSISRFDVIGRLLQAWRENRKVRGRGPEALDDVADAVRVIEAQVPGEERILRQESTRLFGDSKRIERLTPWLEVLALGEVSPTGLSRDDIWAACGLRREPQPMLVAGEGELILATQGVRLARPYLGVAARAIEGFTTTAPCLVSIENLTSFHQATQAWADLPLVLVYSGGMPSPAWRRAYRCLLAGLPARASIYHWGDIDEGGLRIAAVIAAETAATGRSLLPWAMSPQDLPPSLRAGRPRAEPGVLSRMKANAIKAGWPEVAESLGQFQILFEQEGLAPDPGKPPQPVGG